jgi:DNA-binding GntR family transcriptional regulator
MPSSNKGREFTAVDQTALRTRSRAEFVYESLCDAIWDGRISHNERVREEEIARNFGVSRTPVREALQRLQQRGILVAGTGRGLVVADLSQQQVNELYSMREILECSAARFAAQHATATEIAILHRLQRQLRDAPNNATMLVMLNRRFHQAIYQAAHNQYLSQTLDLLHDSFALLHNQTFRMPNRRKESDEEHRKIVMAIEKREPDKAEHAARTHILNAQLTRLERDTVNFARSFIST